MIKFLVSLSFLGLLINCGKDDNKSPAPAEDQFTKNPGWVNVSPVDPNQPTSAGLQQPALSSPEMQKALSAFAGKTTEARGLGIGGHGWNVKAANITRVGDLVMMEGQLSHVLANQLDDQVYYKLAIRNGYIENFAVKYDLRNWLTLANLALPAVSAVSQVPLPLNDIAKLGPKLDSMVFKDWQDQAKILIIRLGTLTAQQI